MLRASIPQERVLVYIRPARFLFALLETSRLVTVTCKLCQKQTLVKKRQGEKHDNNPRY